MKTKEELQELRAEVERLTAALNELTDEELEFVSGGNRWTSNLGTYWPWKREGKTTTSEQDKRQQIKPPIIPAD